MKTAKSKDEYDNLKSILNTRIAGAVCIATVTNGTPCDWNVVIVKAGVEFFYREGGSYVDYDNNLNLTCAQSTTFRSNDPDKCVKTVLCVLQVKVGDDPKLVTVVGKQEAGAGKCAIEAEFTLAPKKEVSESSLRSMDFEQFMTLEVS